MQHGSLKLLAALAVGVGGGLSLGAGTSHADVYEVKPGLTCDEVFLSTTCTNITNTDYTVIQTRECAGGEYTTSTPVYSYGPKGEQSLLYYSTSTHHVDPSTEYVSIFAPANDTGWGPRSSCRLETERFYYSVEPPVPGPVSGGNAAAPPPPPPQ
jgi:hypothetical protein